MPNSTSEIPTPADTLTAIRAAATAEGFDLIRIAPPTLPADAGGRLRRFLAAGYHGTMEWLARNEEKRADPQTLWPEAKSVIILAMRYDPPADGRGDNAIAAYALGDDYHDVIKKRLKTLAGWMVTAFGCEVKVFVDTAPVLEKSLAEQAGLGWQGKHTSLISRELGNWFFLAEIFTTLELPPDRPTTNHCGACHACLAICPTGALTGPGEMDARLCISYLTIEHKGPIPRHLRAPIGPRVYGCDACLAICPWNKFAKMGADPQLMPRPGLAAMDVQDFIGLDDAGFRALFRASPIKRIGRDRFIRNVLIALANTPRHDLMADIIRLLDDASALVRGATVWALGELDPQEAMRQKTLRLPAETDADVRTEWNAINAP